MKISVEGSNRLAVEPGATAGLHIQPLLLSGMRCLFLNVKRRLSRNIQTVEGTTRRRAPPSSLGDLGKRDIRGRLDQRQDERLIRVEPRT